MILQLIIEDLKYKCKQKYIDLISQFGLYQYWRSSFIIIQDMVHFTAALLLLALAIHFVQTQSSQQPQQKSQANIPGVGLAIVFIYGGLLYAGILKALAKQSLYNPLLLISGFFVGYYYKSLGFFGEAAQLVTRFSPNTLLGIFLPPMIFESAYKSEWHLFKKQFKQTLILGIPCVLISSVFIMICLKTFLGYDSIVYTWLEALLLGCILCCTDIFSFITRLKECGTPQKLIGLIEGQSLFNYCTCFLMFQIINEVVINSDKWSILGLLFLLFEETLGGFLVGVLASGISLFFIKRVSSDGIMVVTIMIIFSYTPYLILEFTNIPWSGIISVVTFGILMSIFGKAQLVGDSEAHMKSFWDYAVFIAEANIFLIAGVFVGTNYGYISSIVNIYETKVIMFIYIFSMLSRYLSILIFHRILSKSGYGLQWKQSIIIALSGLKGAIGISFAMIVFESNSYEPTMKNLFLMHVTGNSLLTMLINASIVPLILKLLKISVITKVEHKMFSEYLQKLKHKIEFKKNQLKGEKFLDIVDWREVDQKTGIEQIEKLKKDVEERMRNNNYSKNDNKMEKSQLYILEKTLNDFSNSKQTVQQMADRQCEQENIKFAIIVEIRKRFIKKLRHQYWTFHKKQHTRPEAVLLLVQSANVDLDTETEELESWLWIKNQFQENIKILSQLRKMYILGNFARTYLFSYIFYCYDVVISYIQANEVVQEEFVSEEFAGYNEDAVNLIINESQQNLKEAEQFLNNFLQPCFPEIQKQVISRKASFSLLLSFKDQISKLYINGQLQTSQYESLTNIISYRQKILQIYDPKWTQTPLKAALKSDDVFGLLPDKILAVFEENLTTFETYNTNEVIHSPSSLGKYIYFIRRGNCISEISSSTVVFKQSLVVGDIYGYESLVSKTYHSTITTSTLLVVLGIKTICIMRVMDFFAEFEEAFWKKYAYTLFKMLNWNRDVSYFLNQCSRKDFETIISTLKLKKLEPGKHTICHDSIFFRGNVKIINECFPQKSKNMENLDEIKQDQKEERKLLPLEIIEGNQVQIQVIEKSSFLMGKFEVEDFHKSRYLPSFRTFSKKVSQGLELRSPTKTFQ